MNEPGNRVVSVVIMYGNRWHFLARTIDAILQDEHIIKLIIVDNGSLNEKEIREGVAHYSDRVRVLRQEKNLGSAGGFAVGIAAARKEDCDFVYLSDDDMLPEKDFVDKYLAAKDLFADKKVVICGNRVDVPGNANVFYEPVSSVATTGTFFNVFGFAKFKNFFHLAFGSHVGEGKGVFVPVVPGRGGFVYGGAFIPIEAVRSAPLPDASLFLYGDDIEYAWGIEALGYNAYVSARPIINDIDLTFGQESHIFGLFKKDLHPFKVYYRMRNMVLLSVRHSKQKKLVLFLSVVSWFLGLLLLGLLRFGPSKHYFSRARLIIEAVRAGYDPKRKIPKEAII